MARQAEQDPTNLYIANLPHTIKENDLENMFSQYGRVSYLDKNCLKIFNDICFRSNHLSDFSPLY